MREALKWLLALALCVLTSAERHYVFTAPKELAAGSTERMCLTLLDAPWTGTLRLTLDGAQLLTEPLRVSGVADGSKQTCFDVKLPGHKRFSVWSDLNLSVSFPSQAKYRIHGESRVKIKTVQDTASGYLFIQTDKALYKPGQLVQFRVLSVDSELRPITQPIPLVHIESPAGTRLAQWTDVSGHSGLLQLDFQLSEQPTQGAWKIHVKTADGAAHVKKFRVEEYVLPKFEVNIQGPPYILGDAEHVTWKVCGKYTYGKPVSGTAKLTVNTCPVDCKNRHSLVGQEDCKYRHSLVSQPDCNSRSDTVEKGHTDGDCAEFRLDRSRLAIGRRDVRPSRVRVFAELTEDGTDVTFNVSKSFDIDYTRLKLSVVDDSTKYFKAGLPFVDQIKVSHPDGSGASGERIRLCYTRKRNVNQTRQSTDFGNSGPVQRRRPEPEPIKETHEQPVCETATSDSAGIVTYAMPNQHQDIYEVDIKATLPEHEETQPPMRVDSLSLTVRGWYSASGAFLQLARRPEARYSCGATASIPVHYTRPLGSRFQMFYQVMARGNILLSESVSVAFDEPADLTAELAGVVVVVDAHRATDLPPVGVTTLQIPVDSTMSSGFKVLAYMVVDGELVADSQSYQASPCLENAATLRWSPDRAQPGDIVRLTVTAAPGSLCGLDVVDKSVNLLSTDNRVSLTDFFDRLKKLNLSPWASPTYINDREYCTAKYGSPGDAVPQGSQRIPSIAENPWDCRSYWEPYWKSNYMDSLSAFDRRSMLVLSDLATETRVCVIAYQRKRHFCHFPLFSLSNVQAFAGGLDLRGQGFGSSIVQNSPPRGQFLPRPSVVGIAGSAAEAPVPPPSEVPEEVRTYFPETWLFDLHTISEDGSVTLEKEVPDTITEWVGGAVCSSDLAGLGIAPPATLTAFQPFFVSNTLPYSVKRGETLVLKVSVLSYNTESLPVKLTLVASDEFETLGAAVVTRCVESARAEVVPYRLRPSALGQVNITVVAEVYPDYPAACGPETVLHFQDAITRPVLVEPEGFERDITYSNFLCITPESAELSADPSDLDVTWRLELPADLVPGSERAKIAVVGDLLGPSIDNLESLVRQPTGCGEQNMVLFTPNIHVMNYLSAVGELTEDLKQKLVNHMKTGYQRELTYRHPDKSYSAFGARDSSGSMWLTAFVVKSFGDAKKYIFIDDDDLESSVRWIETQQTEDGCFPSTGRVLHKEMKGGVVAGGQKALTAFVTITLIQSGVKLRNNTLQNAFECLDRTPVSDVYTQTLRTYALALAGRQDVARQGLTELRSQAVRGEGLMHWRSPGSGENRALSVEIGSYAVLTLQKLSSGPGGPDFSDALGAVRWITKQRNSRGGFVSTQDTVLALEALAGFSAGLPRSSSADLRLHLSSAPDAAGAAALDDTVRVTAANRLLMQRREVPALPAAARVRAEGTGCALVQAMLTYNVYGEAPSDALNISVSAKPKERQRECLKHNIDVCVGYEKEGESNMAVVELEMVSGFIPNKGSLKALERDAELELKRWEVASNKVVFYFDSLGARRRCFQLLVQRDTEVEDAKSAVASVYDYYQTEFSLSTSYALDVDCESAPIWHPAPVLPPILPVDVAEPQVQPAGNP